MSSHASVEEIKRKLGLRPHPREGGWFAETWRAQETIRALPELYGSGAERAAGTAIYYLLEPGHFSEMHRLRSDEVFHFYLGDPVEMLQLWPDGTGRRVMLGTDLAAGILPQTVVPQGVWQGSRLVEGGRFALLGCTVSPGFDYEDYESGTRAELLAEWREWADLIEGLTHR
ncbi:MAG TPA: cupin domain-containing protein [Acidobacteriaceae bacterium]|nr:cupin domain-containing protein [Acidobacteriaceae bacterium]